MIIRKTRIVAAEGDDFDSFDSFDDFGEVSEEDDGLNDQLDDIADDIEDMKDDVEDFQEDDPSIEIDNNITDHYIAECEKCKGIFISAVSESEQEVTSITGVCPLCGKESVQNLRWVVKSVE